MNKTEIKVIMDRAVSGNFSASEAADWITILGQETLRLKDLHLKRTLDTEKIITERDRMKKTLLHILEVQRLLTEGVKEDDYMKLEPLDNDSQLSCDCLWGLTGEGQGF